MDFIWNSITDWLKEVLVSGIVSNLSGMFDSTNEQIGQIAGQVGLTPQAWNSGIFNMIQNLSNNVILPLAGAILAVVMTLELIQLITDRNNLNDVDTWMFFKWVFKSAAAVLIVSNTWTIVMGIFDLQFHANTNKQFITIETRSGEIFYIVIDYDAPVDEKSEQFSTYFLNKVDDADLMAILEDGNKVEVCGCIDRCYAGHVNTTCPICAKNMTECVGREPEPTEEPTTPATEPVKEPEKKSNSGVVLAVLLMTVMVGVMGWYFLKKKMPNPKTKGDTDLDDYDYGMDEDDEDYAEFESYNEQEETESK